LEVGRERKTSSACADRQTSAVGFFKNKQHRTHRNLETTPINESDSKLNSNWSNEAHEKNFGQLQRSGPQLLRIHAIWGLCQFDRITKSPKRDILELLGDPDPEIRSQVARSFGEILTSKLALHQAPNPRATSFDFHELVKCLKDNSPRVRSHAAIALGNLGALGSSKAIIEMARNIPDESSTYQRHAAIAGLTGCASSKMLASLAGEQS
jgi:hypothetical protein